MLFRLDCLRDNESIELFFDTLDCCVTSRDGKVLNEQILEPSKSTILPFSESENPNGINRDAHQLEIILGLKCNLRCSYCNQQSFRNNVHSSSLEDVPHFLKRFDDLGIKPKVVRFGGGEPLVYWDVFKALVIDIRDRIPEVAFFTITNATLLDDEKLDFIKKHRINITVSADGLTPRGASNILVDSKLMLQKAAKKLGPLLRFSAVLTNQTPDVMLVREQIQDAIGGSPIFSCCPLKLRSKDGDVLTEEASQKISQSVFEALYDGWDGGVRKSHIEGFVRALLSRARLADVRSDYCPYNCGNILTDLKWSAFRCHTEPKPLGTIDALPMSLPSVGGDWTQRKNCSRCAYIHMCKGFCPSLEGDARKLSCEYISAFWLGAFRYVFGSLFGVYVEKISPIEQ